MPSLIALIGGALGYLYARNVFIPDRIYYAHKSGVDLSWTQVSTYTAEYVLIGTLLFPVIVNLGRNLKNYAAALSFFRNRKRREETFITHLDNTKKNP
jgi:hypothetical protein